MLRIVSLIINFPTLIIDKKYQSEKSVKSQTYTNTIYIVLSKMSIY